MKNEMKSMLKEFALLVLVQILEVFIERLVYGDRPRPSINRQYTPYYRRSTR